MTTTLRARIKKSPKRGFWVIHFNGPPGVTLLPKFALSWPEAMQTAYEHLAKLDRVLMDQVYTERMQRRYGPIHLTAQDVHTMEATA